MKNIIFDIGNVLLSFQPKDYLKKYYDQDTSNDLYHIIFESPLWLQLDEGTVTTNEVIHKLSHHYPQYVSEISFILNHWSDMLTPIEENVKVLNTLKEQCPIYLLSNFHDQVFEEMYEKYNFLRDVDGMIISSKVHQLKPDALIYHSLFNTYHLDPHECLFIDDSIANIEKAKELGIETVHLTEDKDLKQECIKAGLVF